MKKSIKKINEKVLVQVENDALLLNPNNVEETKQIMNNSKNYFKCLNIVSKILKPHHHYYYDHNNSIEVFANATKTNDNINQYYVCLKINSETVKDVTILLPGNINFYSYIKNHDFKSDFNILKIIYSYMK